MQYDVRQEEFAIHVQFKDMVAKAQKHADKKQSPVEVSWRGYTMKVKPNLPTFTQYDLDTILLQAVDTLLAMEKKKEKEEEATKKKRGDEDIEDIFALNDTPKSSKLSTKKLKERKVRC